MQRRTCDVLRQPLPKALRLNLRLNLSFRRGLFFLFQVWTDLLLKSSKNKFKSRQHWDFAITACFLSRDKNLPISFLCTTAGRAISRTVTDYFHCIIVSSHTYLRIGSMRAYDKDNISSWEKRCHRNDTFTVANIIGVNKRCPNVACKNEQGSCLIRIKYRHWKD